MDYYKSALERLGIVEITCWSRLDGGEWHHNHIEQGHSRESYPVGHASWAGYTWSKLWTYGTDSQPMVID